MAYMNVMTRNKLKIVIVEAYKLKKKEGKVDSTIQNLNSKILRAKTKLEVVSVVEEKARSIVRNLFGIGMASKGHRDNENYQAEIDVTRGRGHERNGDRRGDLNAAAGGRSSYGR
ncbi:hypothetical protein Fmac_032604 [Flemingia macrophylla]|uniref:Uncharacterized protein n=1 Tax=Flemingia macrophylla TaxID=520843 RepID=A0ABD1L5T9_9FABA